MSSGLFQCRSAPTVTERIVNTSFGSQVDAVQFHDDIDRIIDINFRLKLYRAIRHQSSEVWPLNPFPEMFKRFHSTNAPLPMAGPMMGPSMANGALPITVQLEKIPFSWDESQIITLARSVMKVRVFFVKRITTLEGGLRIPKGKARLLIHPDDYQALMQWNNRLWCTTEGVWEVEDGAAAATFLQDHLNEWGKDIPYRLMKVRSATDTSK